MRENYFKSPYLEMWIEGGILWGIYQQGIVVTKEVAVSQIKERIRITNEVTYPIFIDLRGVKYFTKEAREELKKGDGIKYISAGGFLINSVILRIFGDYFIKLEKPTVPVKIIYRTEESFGVATEI